MELRAGMWVLLLNDMRSAHVQEMEPVACADTREELEQFVKDETVECYQTDNEGRIPPRGPTVNAEADLATGEVALTGVDLGDCHMSNYTWGKTFRRGGPLEWFNRPDSLFAENYVQYFPRPAPQVPHISELKQQGCLLAAG